MQSNFFFNKSQIKKKTHTLGTTSKHLKLKIFKWTIKKSSLKTIFFFTIEGMSSEN